MIRLLSALRRFTSKYWLLSRLHYRLHRMRLEGGPDDLVWYFAFGANMHDSAFLERRGMQPFSWRSGRICGYRLRFNLDGWPRGKSAPANVSPDPGAEVWGVMYQITRRALVVLDASEGVPGWGYRHLWTEAEDEKGNKLPVVTYMADGKAEDGNPSLRYITLLREGARAHGLPERHLQILDAVKHAE